MSKSTTDPRNAHSTDPARRNGQGRTVRPGLAVPTPTAGGAGMASWPPPTRTTGASPRRIRDRWDGDRDDSDPEIKQATVLER